MDETKAPAENGNAKTYSLYARMSPEIGELTKALAAAQLDFKPVKKDTKNPFYNSKYADLSSVIAATQPGLSKNGLVVIQSPIVDPETEKAGVSTLLAHASGQWLSNELMLPATMKSKDGTVRFDAQSVGSAITYARRYTYQAMIGVAGEEDDDGNRAVGIGTQEAAQNVATSKLRKAANGDESVTLVPWKQGLLALQGNGLAILRANLTATEKTKITVKMDSEAHAFTIPESQGNQFASLCEKYKVECKWAAEEAEPGEAG